MACLYRAFTMGRQTLKGKMSRWNKKRDTLTLYGSKWSNIYLFVGGYGLYNISESEVSLISEAEKYVLLGEKPIVERVKNQITAESTRTTVRSMWYKSRKAEIEIVEDEMQYEKLKDETKQIRLILCVTTESDNANVEHFLPKKILTNIESRDILMEHRMGNEILEKTMNWLKKDPEVGKHFKGTKITRLTPDVPHTYPTRHLDDLTTLNGIVYLVSQALFLFGKFRHG